MIYYFAIGLFAWLVLGTLGTAVLLRYEFIDANETVGSICSGPAAAVTGLFVLAFAGLFWTLGTIDTLRRRFGRWFADLVR